MTLNTFRSRFGLTPTQAQRGFTLIELLVVIAIIGILSAVVLTSLGSARGKARVASAQQTMNTVRTAALFCLNDNAAITGPTESITGGGGLLCANNSGRYVSLPTGWVWCDGTASCQSSTTASFSQTQGSVFRLVAASTNDLKVIMCNESYCATY